MAAVSVFDLFHLVGPLYELYWDSVSCLSTGLFSVLGISCATLVVAGEYLRRTVGFLYQSEEGSRIRVGRVSFFGNRRDFELDLTDIVPLTDTGENINQTVWKIRLYPDCPAAKSGLGDVLYVVGGDRAVVNPQRFNDIFGQVVDDDSQGGGSVDEAKK